MNTLTLYSFDSLLFNQNMSFCMNRFLLLTLLILLQFSAIGQPYQIGHVSLTLIDSARSNRAVPTEVYYPSDIAGDNMPFSSVIGGKVPLISFGHGFVMTYDAYFNFRDALVPNGYIIAFPKTEGSLSPAHGEFGKDLAFVIRAVSSLNALSSSILYGKIDTMNCVMGHSMGGGAAFLALTYDPAIKSIVTFAAAETTPSAIAAAAGIAAPALVFSGLNDCVSPPAANQQPMYAGLASACKHYIGIKGGSHCRMAESNLACGFGESTCTPAPTISRATQHDVIDSFLLPWLDYTLKSSCAAGGRFDLRTATDTSITFLKNCSLCIAASAGVSNSKPKMKVYPNPAYDKIYFDEVPDGYSTLTIVSVTGEKLWSGKVKNTVEIPVTEYAQGVYFYEFTGQAAQPVRGLFSIKK